LRFICDLIIVIWNLTHKNMTNYKSLNDATHYEYRAI
jgi:hypothetical protein